MKNENEKSDGFYIIQDTREQNPFEFENCLGVDIESLKTGDYSIRGLESKLCIERKASVPEIANNLVKEWDRFERELERMREYPHSFIVCEFSVNDVFSYPHYSNLSKDVKKVVKTNGKFLMKKLMEIELEYDTKILFCGNKVNATRLTYSLMKRCHERYSQKEAG